MMQMVRSIIRNEKGQGMVEYGLILALIAVAVMGTMQLMGTSLDTMMQSVKTAI